MLLQYKLNEMLLAPGIQKAIVWKQLRATTAIQMSPLMLSMGRHGVCGSWSFLQSHLSEGKKQNQKPPKARKTPFVQSDSELQRNHPVFKWACIDSQSPMTSAKRKLESHTGMSGFRPCISIDCSVGSLCPPFHSPLTPMELRIFLMLIPELEHAYLMADFNGPSSHWLFSPNCVMVHMAFWEHGQKKKICCDLPGNCIKNCFCLLFCPCVGNV